MSGKIFPITSLPGISRDGTDFYSKNYIDGQWVRFYGGRPRKIGGYFSIDTRTFDSIPRGTYVIPKVPNFDVYIGTYNKIQYISVDQLGSVIGTVVNRTPPSLIESTDNIWQFDIMFDTTSNASVLIAHAAPNLASINNDAETPVFYGDTYATDALKPTGFSVSGGIFSLHPYLCMFGNAGQVIITNANDPSTLLQEARVCAQKIVAGFATRGGSSAPAGLLWSLDSVIRVSLAQGAGISEVLFSFDTIATESSILSSQSIVEWDGLFFWAAQDRFLMYNGVVREVPNKMNLRFFFRSLNYAQRQKVWATKITAWGEIWWHYPSEDSIECNRAVVYNVWGNFWFDTDSNRGSGYFEQVFGFPIWTSNVKNIVTNAYTIWEHETGVDAIEDNVSTKILSTFQTGCVSYPAVGPSGEWIGTDRQIELYRIEPDFAGEAPLSRLYGNMSVVVRGRDYANGPDINSGSYIFNAGTQRIDLREQRREMNLIFTSDEIGGFYEMGQVLLYFRVGDVRP